MVTNVECMPLILEKFPGFQPRWQKHLAFWGEEEAGLCNDVSAFSHYVEELINENKSTLLGEIFNLAEYLMKEGDETVRTAIATCFLENLINFASHGSIQASGFVEFLGPESRDYCKAWDEFCGAKTEGLWEE